MPSQITPYRPRATVLEKLRRPVELREEQWPARRAAMRLHGARLVAHVGMANIEILTALEVQMARRGGAVIDSRIAAVVDTYVGVVNSELTQLALGGE